MQDSVDERPSSENKNRSDRKRTGDLSSCHRWPIGSNGCAGVTHAQAAVDQERLSVAATGDAPTFRRWIAVTIPQIAHNLTAKHIFLIPTWLWHINGWVRPVSSPRSPNERQGDGVLYSYNAADDRHSWRSVIPLARRTSLGLYTGKVITRAVSVPPLLLHPMAASFTSKARTRAVSVPLSSFTQWQPVLPARQEHEQHLYPSPPSLNGSQLAGRRAG